MPAATARGRAPSAVAGRGAPAPGVPGAAGLGSVIVRVLPRVGGVVGGVLDRVGAVVQVVLVGVRGVVVTAVVVEAPGAGVPRHARAGRRGHARDRRGSGGRRRAWPACGGTVATGSSRRGGPCGQLRQLRRLLLGGASQGRLLLVEANVGRRDLLLGAG